MPKRRTIFTEEEINKINDDISKGATHAQIIRAYGITPGILNYLKKKGKILPTNFKVNDGLIERANKMRIEKCSYERIARELGISLAYVFALKRKGKII